jgi:hypothetical protein
LTFFIFYFYFIFILFYSKWGEGKREFITRNTKNKGDSTFQRTIRNESNKDLAHEENLNGQKGYNKWQSSVNGTKPIKVTIMTISGW